MQFSQTKNYWKLALLILLAGFFLRLVESTSLPIFLDEALHIGRAYEVLDGNFFNDGFNQNKWLYSVALAGFLPQGPESVFLSRYLNVLLATVTIAACISVVALLGRRSTGLIAGLIYVVLPLAVFHERQALVDPMMTTFAMLAVVFALRFLRKQRITWAIGIIICLIIAYLTKLAGLAYFFVPLVAAVVLTQSWRERLFKTGLTIAAVGAAALLLVRFYDYLDDEDIGTIQTYSADQGNLIVVSERLLQDLADYSLILWRYGGVVLCAVLLSSLVLLLTHERWRPMLFLLLSIGGLTLVPFIAARPVEDFLPRYVMYSAPLIAALAAVAVEQLGSRWRETTWVQPALIVGIVLQSLCFNALLIVAPRQAPLVPVDRSQYITGSPSSFEYKALAEYVLTEKARTQQAPFLLIEGDPEILQAYFGLTGGSISALDKPSDAQRFAVASALARGDAVYIADDVRTDSTLDLPLYGEVTEQVAQFDGSARDLWLHQVEAARDPLATLVYEQLVALPEAMTNDVETIAEQTQASVRYALPANFAAPLDGEPLDVSQWPLEADGAGQALPQQAPNTTFAVIWVDEAALDPQRRLPILLSESYFLLREHWAGLLHSVEYDTGPSSIGARTNGTRLEGVIYLEEDALIDTDARPGDYIRVYTAWRSQERIEDSFELFFHLLAVDGQLVAQADGVPVNGLRPTSSWAVDEIIQDRRVVHIPESLPSGEYRLVVGMYLPQSGLRLPVTPPERDTIATTGDTIVLGSVNIE